jgi:hypothetical protein
LFIVRRRTAEGIRGLSAGLPNERKTMKISHAVVFGMLVTALAAAPAGKGGGNSGGGKGAGFDRPASPPAPDTAPARHSDRGVGNDVSSPVAERGKGAGKGERSASGAAQGLASSMHEINQTAFAQRRELHDSLDMRLKSSRDALKQIQTSAKNARVDARADFKTALDDVKSREGELAGALKASRKATEANWEPNRQALARAYQNHADALARLEAIPNAVRP